MSLFYLPAAYLVGLTVWIVGVGMLFVFSLKQRQARKRAGRSLTLPHALLSTACVLGVLTLAEIFCAFFVDQSDAFNMTNISKRWFRKYIEAQRNSAGWRDRREFTRTLPAGMRRIVFFGDSFTVGHGIRRCEDRFSDRLESELETVHPGEYQVANLAEPGMETSQITALVKATLDQDYQVDIAVYVFMLNDIEGYDPQTQAVIQRMQQAEPRFFLLSQTYFPNFLYFRWRQAAGGGGEYFPHLKESYETAPWDGLRRKLDQLHRECESRKVDLRMVIFPFLHNLGPDYPFLAAHEKLRSYCEAAHIPVLDLEPILTPHAKEGLVVNRFDAHPNERAHELVAKALKENLLRDLFEKSPSPAVLTAPESTATPADN